MSTKAHVPPPIDPVKPFDRLLLQLERRQVLEPINRLCAEQGVLIEEVLGDSRRAPIARARHMVWWWLADEKRWSYRVIGDLFGVDASSVRSGIVGAGRELGLVQYEGRGRRARRAA